MTRIEVPNSSPRRGRSRRGARVLVILLLLVVVGIAFWTWLTLAWAYSEGERAGTLQKFSRKGWICKTQEGEIAQFVVAGVSPQLWQFSVRDPAVAARLSKAVGRQVQLHYTEHPGVPTGCFADTRYFVDGVTVTDDPSANRPLNPGSAPALGTDVRPGTTLATPTQAPPAQAPPAQAAPTQAAPAQSAPAQSAPAPTP